MSAGERIWSVRSLLMRYTDQRQSDVLRMHPGDV